MQAVEEALARVFAALRAVAPPRGMERRILERCASWLSIHCHSPSADQPPPTDQVI
jgi:hypothetical protein